MEKIKIETRVFIDGIAIEDMNEFRMKRLFEKSGYSGMFFDRIKFLKIKNGIAYFKQISRQDEIYVGLIFLDLEKGEVDVEANCESFDLKDDDFAMQYYQNIDGSKI